ncbi:transcriptional activator domain-containing protein [Andreprevotia lacus DSM 23236]|jgi:predicted Zn-dependent protease|uniref:Transcriptional activator domain-containing protein n=1 Tax=Andreprevotia lacus DSM 23236 TaxID=1121001 RepID=A0A1W1Y0B8_9NEIS|nr:tetratricopeptide repeat protein [Andreprevotia lacus]SMC29231.1 transcriptional activator domain-containing protein [Andreprevotia lacus DSM 23236]
MNPKQIEALSAMLAKGQDNALLRFGLGQALLGNEQAADAVPHLQAAVAHDPNYSAAWKLLGKALAASGDAQAAMDAYQRGITVAEAKGDLQAVKEMQVFLKRLQRELPPAPQAGR